MPFDALQREVATIALRAAARHGFALAGGNALIAHGIIDVPAKTSSVSATRKPP